MKKNGKFCLALHALGHMASSDRLLSSVEIADHSGTNPVVVRRVLGLLREAGLVQSETGFGGGWRMAHDAGSMTLADVYLALDEPFLRPLPEEDEPDCDVQFPLRSHVCGALEAAETLFVDRLRAVTVAEIATGPSGETNVQKEFRE